MRHGRVRWMTASLDTPVSTEAAARAFWLAVTDTQPLRRPSDDAVALQPRHGDAFLQIQAVKHPPARVHLVNYHASRLHCNMFHTIESFEHRHATWFCHWIRARRDDADARAAGLNRSEMIEQALRNKHLRVALQNYTTPNRPGARHPDRDVAIAHAPDSSQSRMTLADCHSRVFAEYHPDRTTLMLSGLLSTFADRRGLAPTARGSRLAVPRMFGAGHRQVARPGWCRGIVSCGGSRIGPSVTTSLPAQLSVHVRPQATERHDFRDPMVAHQFRHCDVSTVNDPVAQALWRECIRRIARSLGSYEGAGVVVGVGFRQAERRITISHAGSVTRCVF